MEYSENQSMAGAENVGRARSEDGQVGVCGSQIIGALTAGLSFSGERQGIFQVVKG